MTIVITALAVLLGLALLYSLAILCAALNTRGSKSFIVSSVDEQGNSKTEKRIVPDCDRFARDGLSHVAAYVARVVQSKASRAGVTITTPNLFRGLDVTCIGPRVVVVRFHFVWWQRCHERAIRDLFERQGIVPWRDSLRPFYGPGMVRTLAYGLPGDTSLVTDLCMRSLRDGWYIKEHEVLAFMVYEDPPQPSEDASAEQKGGQKPCDGSPGLR